MADTRKVPPDPVKNEVQLTHNEACALIDNELTVAKRRAQDMRQIDIDELCDRLNRYKPFLLI
jgi:hypothetical protein